MATIDMTTQETWDIIRAGIEKIHGAKYAGFTASLKADRNGYQCLRLQPTGHKDDNRVSIELTTPAEHVSQVRTIDDLELSRNGKEEEQEIV